MQHMQLCTIRQHKHLSAAISKAATFSLAPNLSAHASLYIHHHIAALITWFVQQFETAHALTSPQPPSNLLIMTKCKQQATLWLEALPQQCLRSFQQ
jgi:hypothetical protein